MKTQKSNKVDKIIFIPKMKKVHYPDDLPDFFFIYLDINANIEKSWNEFAESKELPYMKFDVKLGGYKDRIIFITAESGLFIPDNIIEGCDKKYKLITKEHLDGSMPDSDILVLPYIQFSLKLVPEDEGSSIDAGKFYYDIFTRRFFTEFQYASAYPGYFTKCVKVKIKKTTNKNYRL